MVNGDDNDGLEEESLVMLRLKDSGSLCTRSSLSITDGVFLSLYSFSILFPPDVVLAA